MSFKFARPEDEGIAPYSILNFLDTCEKEIQYLYSFAVVKNENMVAEGYYAPMTPGIRKIMHSVSKSVNSLAVGIAIDEGKLGLEDKVLDYFRDKLPPQYDERFEELKVKHLLMMSSNSAYTSASFVGKGGDWLTHYFSLTPYNVPGREFHYDTGASYTLSCLVTKATGKSTFDFVNERLFKPMGIKNAAWLSDNNGNSTGGWGLYIKFPDMVKLGQLFLNYGKWEGKQLVPEWYMKEATSHKIETKNDPGMGWSYGYGYQFWQGPGNTFLAFGAFGQLIVCDPTKNMFVATTAGCSEQENQRLLGIIYETIISPALNQAIPRQDAEYEKLTDRISSLCLPLAEGGSESNLEEGFFGKKYAFDSNSYKVSSIQFTRKNENTIQIRMNYEGEDVVVDAGYKKWLTTEAPLDTPMHTMHSFSYAWKDESTLLLVQYMLNSSYSKFYEFRLTGDGVTLSVALNQTLYDDKPEVVLGRAK